ncbi:MAG: CHASE2 domain-containing protein, partial [Nitrospirae bacterium]|nr:CHASE2 domain-containing protein [Nitrospirota bacterium]
MGIKSLFKGKFLVLFVGIITTLLCAVILLSKPIFLRFLDGKVYDLFLISIHNTKKSSIPVIIDIDEKSLKRYGQWPWPRYRVALLLERLKALGVTAVGLDIVFSEGDRTSPLHIKQSLLTDLNLNIGFTGIPEGLMDNDKLLAKTLSNGPYVLGYKFLFEKEGLKNNNCVLNPVNISFIDEVPNSNKTSSLFEPSEVLCNIPVLSESAKGSGFYNTANDRDGTFRAVPLLMKYKDNYYPNLALATYLYAAGTNQLIIKRDQLGIKQIKA